MTIHGSLSAIHATPSHFLLSSPESPTYHPVILHLPGKTTMITHRTARINRAGKRHENQMLILPSSALHITSHHIYPATITNASLSLIYDRSSQPPTRSYTDFFIQPMFTDGINTKHKHSLDLIHLPHRNATHSSSTSPSKRIRSLKSRTLLI
jgi:hypothetical protein